MLEGAGGAEDPPAVYARQFVPNAAAGVGLVIQGNTSPGMSASGERARTLALAPLTRAVHDAGGKIVTSSGSAPPPRPT